MTRSSSTISRALLGGRGFRRRAGRSVLPDAAGAASVPFSIPLGFRFGRPFSPFSRVFSSLSAATLASSCATVSSKLTTRDRNSAAERSSRSGRSLGQSVMPPSTHIPRRRGIPLSQFDAPVNLSPLPPVFENSPMQHLKAGGKVYSRPLMGFDAVGGKLVANDAEQALLARMKTMRA